MAGEQQKGTNPGVKAADLAEALRDRKELALQRPESLKPKSLIESLRFKGQSRLTAADGKLYEMLLARARKQGLDREFYEVTMSEATGFLNEPNLARVRDSVERLGSTFVTYDYVDGQEVRRWGTLRLLGYEGVEDLKSGTSRLVYWLEPPVRRELALAEAQSYALIDLHEVSLFRCRYTPRLYDLLNLRAGYDAEFRRPWTVTVEDLSAMLGYFPARFDYHTFRRDVLDPSMADIEQAVTRFQASYKEERSGGGRRGRGGRVAGLTFTVTGASRKTDGMQASRVSSHVYEEAYRAKQSGDMDMPSSLTVGRAVTAHGESDMVMWARWKDALAKAKDSPSADVDGLEASVLLHVLSREGADAAFTFWADAVFGKPSKPVAPAFIREEEPAPAKDAPPEPKAAPSDCGPPPRPEDFADVQDFHAASAAWLDARRARKPADVRSPWEVDEGKVRKMAGGIVDMLDGKTDEFVDLGWVRNMTSPDYGWSVLGEPHMSLEARRAWQDVEEGLAVLRRLPLKPQNDAVRRGPLRAIAAAVAAWDLDRAAAAARVVVAKAPPPEAIRVQPPPPPMRRGWQPVSEAHAETGYGGYYGDLAEAEAEAERQHAPDEYLALLADPDYAGDPLED